MKNSCFVLALCIGIGAYAQPDLNWTKNSPAGMVELQINSAGSLLQGFMYKANGAQPHPTLLLLHGYPGNERNLDLAQAVRARGWNVIYFNYRGSWGSQGDFTFRHCVEDVRNVIAWCSQHAQKLQIDTRNIALFGHSMGGFVCLQALADNPGIKKGFALSAWNIYADAMSKSKSGKMGELEKEADNYFVLHKKSGKDLFAPVLNDPAYYNLSNLAQQLSAKQVVMLDEHRENAALAKTLQQANHAYFNYEVWATDHPFTNKRGSLIKAVIAFLDRP